MAASFGVALFVFFKLAAAEGFGVFDALAFLFLMPASPIAVTFWTVLKRFGGGARLCRELAKIADGLRVVGVFWKN